jgi:Flp pilus assembly protein TadG
MRIRKLRDDCSGIALPAVALALVVIVGTAAVAFDSSRFMSVQSQLQNAADAMALAGPAELDRRPGSIIRAGAAIRNLLTNPVVGADFGQVAKFSSIEFLSSLPANDDPPLRHAILPTTAQY